MTQDDIIEMARQVLSKDIDGLWLAGTPDLEAFAKLVAAKEREACAKVCESLPTVGELRQLERATMKDCAHAIRARGEA
jgi:hypothetical protein